MNRKKNEEARKAHERENNPHYNRATGIKRLIQRFREREQGDDDAGVGGEGGEGTDGAQVGAPLNGTPGRRHRGGGRHFQIQSSIEI